MSFFKCNCLLSCCISCLPACNCIHPVFSASFVYFIVCCYALPVWLMICFCLYISLIFLSPLWTLEHHSCVRLCITMFFFFLCRTSSFCSVPSSSLPVLIWKCFGLQRMMVDIEEIKRPCGPINSPFKKTFKQPNNSLVKSTIRALDYSGSDRLHSEQFEL